MAGDPRAGATTTASRVIEDASHAIGGALPRRAGRQLPLLATSTVFSFHPVKIVTTGEGGMVLTNDARPGRTAALLRSHGITRDPARWQGEPRRPLVLRADRARLQLPHDRHAGGARRQPAERLDQFVARRHALARALRRAAGRPAADAADWQRRTASSALHLYVVRLQLDAIAATHRAGVRRACARAASASTCTTSRCTPSPTTARWASRRATSRRPKRTTREAISLPMYPGLSDEAQDQVVAALREVLR